VTVEESGLLVLGGVTEELGFLAALPPIPLFVRKLWSGFDLRLMSSLNDVSAIPTEGKDLIIVAEVNNVLRFRIFDGDGKVAADTDEQRLTEQARQIEGLREQLESLWPPHELTRSESGRVITAVTSIVNHTQPNHRRASPPRRFVPFLCLHDNITV
jgi:hypothetical protein